MGSRSRPARRTPSHQRTVGLLRLLESARRNRCRRCVERDGVRWYNTGDVVRWNPEDGYHLSSAGRRHGEAAGVPYRARRNRAGAVSAPEGCRSSGGCRCRTDATVKNRRRFSPAAAPAPSTVELKTFCAKTLPAYMSPDLFVFLDRLPRTSTDKVDVQALKSQVLHASVG